jgi:hypothetical protein
MSGPKFSLVDLGKVSKPLSKLVDAVSQGIGTLYEPTRIRRKARAQADASLIKAEADIKKKELLRRAANRLAFQEIYRQENIEHIIEIAAENLPDTVSDEPVDRDWVFRFFDGCKDVSNEELQKLWAQLLASEVTAPKSCSRKTLSILRDMSLGDAITFKKVCSLAWETEGDYFIPYDNNFTASSQFEIYKIMYWEILQLETLGLICSQNDIVTKINYGDTLSYFKFNHVCHINPPNFIAKISCYPLTDPGIELLKVANRDINLNFYVDCLKLFSYKYYVCLACAI